jgi:hypothetical protein
MRTMRVFARSRLALATLVAATLVTAQLAGLVHRVVHPAVSGNGAPLAWSAAAAANGHVHPRGQAHDDTTDSAVRHQTSDPDSKGGATHGCAAYDAATLAQAPPLSPAATASFDRAQDAPSARVAGLAGGVVRLGYLSRAPPRA